MVVHVREAIYDPQRSISSLVRTAMLANTFRRVVKAATNRAIYPRYSGHLQKRIVPGCFNLGKFYTRFVCQVLLVCKIAMQIWSCGL